MVETVITSYLTGQMTPEIIDSIQQPAMIGVVTNLILVTVAAILMVAFICWAIGMAKKTDAREVENNKSKVYRSLMTDMYVVGAVRKFAKEDSIDIEEELKLFAKAEKKKDSKGRAIDDVIEDNLNEKIGSKTDKELEKIEGK
jgi:type III secretory pathway component EscR